MEKKTRVRKMINKNIRFNYFESVLIVDENIMKKINRSKEAIPKIKALKKKKYTEQQNELLENEDNINKQYDRLNRYSASAWDMKPMIEYILNNKIDSTAIDIGGIIVEIEPGSITQFDEDIVSFQLTKMRDNMLPAKKKVGETKKDIMLTDEEYIGDFVSILYDGKYSVLMIQSNSYGLSANQIQAYFTLLRRKYIELANLNGTINELACELRVLIDPKKAEKILDAKYFRKVRVKGSDFMLDSMIDNESKSLLGKARRLLGNNKGVNFDIVLSVNTTDKTDTLDVDEVKELVDEFNSIEGVEKKPSIEITKKDTDDSSVELVNLLHPRLNSIINFKIAPRISIGNDFLYDKMKETYLINRGTISRITTS
ncbi:DUF6731 family protein [Clostridium sp.]|uniref:DUF6731 family protein n=1 Tax=Clostridium sp. TaxID=1506 RepID=UPI002623F89F|nr:DUF6731 family protein [Clostridium sp.]